MDAPETSHKRSHIVGFHLYEASKIGRRRWFPRVWIAWKVIANGYGVSFLGNENILKLGVWVVQL